MAADHASRGASKRHRSSRLERSIRATMLKDQKSFDKNFRERCPRDLLSMM
jgi:hypothetical protein